MARLGTMALDAGQGMAPQSGDRDAAATGADDAAARKCGSEGTDRQVPPPTAQVRVDAARDALERRKARARRTAWIIAAIAAAFFIASLFQGHFAQIPH